MLLPAEEKYTMQGIMPPWIIEEYMPSTAEDDIDPDWPAGFRPYWVNYRTGYQYLSQSPLHEAEERRILAARHAADPFRR